MAADYRNSLGFLNLQLAAQDLQRQQAKQTQLEQFNRESQQQGFTNSLQMLQHSTAAKAADEDRKLALAGLMQRAQEANALKAQLAGQAIDAKKPKQDAEVAKLAAQTADYAHDNAAQDVGINETHEQNQTGNALKAYDAQTKRAGLPLQGPFGGMNVAGYDKTSGLPQLEGGIIAGGTDSPLDGPSSPTAPITSPGNPSSSESSEPPTGRVEDAPIRPDTYSKAVEALKKGQGTQKLFDDAISKTDAVPEGDFGTLAEGVHLPSGLPWGLGNLGIPGTNAGQDFLLGLGIDSGKIKQAIKNGPFPSANPGQADEESNTQTQVDTRAEARAAVQKLSQHIALELLGTTSTAAQEARVQKIIGMTNNQEFLTNKKTQLKVMREAQKVDQQNRTENEYMVRHKRAPLGELPDMAAPTAAAEAMPPALEPIPSADSDHKAKVRAYIAAHPEASLKDAIDAIGE